jgi:hypothetical protein
MKTIANKSGYTEQTCDELYKRITKRYGFFAGSASSPQANVTYDGDVLPGFDSRAACRTTRSRFNN